MEVLEQLPRGKILLQETKDENRPRSKKNIVKRQEERIINWLNKIKINISSELTSHKQ